MLTRMLAAGWLADGWEDPATIEARPPPRYYQLTDEGAQQLGALLRNVRSDKRFTDLSFGWA